MAAEDEDITEVFKNFITRLELLTGTGRIKVPPEQNDEFGNPILPMLGTYLVDDVGDLHESANTDGDVRVIGWPAGSSVVARGRFTKSGGAGTGAILISMASAVDEFYLIHGQILVGAVKAGGADTLIINAQNGVGTGAGTNAGIFFEGNADVNQVVNLPVAFADAALAVGNEARMDKDSMFIGNTDQGISISLAGMANAETFNIVIWFRSRSGVTPVVAVTGGTFV